MFKRMLLVVPMVLALAFAGALAQDDPTVETVDDPDLGTYLVDAEGMTLYLFTNDEVGSGVSVCHDECAENWPPFVADDPLVLPDGVPGELTQITRDDGSEMVAYNGIPLYYFAADQEPGDTTGHEVGDVWYVVNPGEAGVMPGASPEASPMASPEATPEY